MTIQTQPQPTQTQPLILQPLLDLIIPRYQQVAQDHRLDARRVRINDLMRHVITRSQGQPVNVDTVERTYAAVRQALGRPDLSAAGFVRLGDLARLAYEYARGNNALLEEQEEVFGELRTFGRFIA